jgi:hypothetical protein
MTNATLECAEEEKEAEEAERARQDEIEVAELVAELGPERARARPFANKKQQDIEFWNLKSAALTDLLALCEVEKRNIEAAQDEETKFYRWREAEQHAEISKGRPHRDRWSWWVPEAFRSTAQRDWERNVQLDFDRKYWLLLNDVWKERVQARRNLLWATLVPDAERSIFRPGDVNSPAFTSLLEYLPADKTLLSVAWLNLHPGSYVDRFLYGVDTPKEAVQRVSVSARKIKDTPENDWSTPPQT